MEKQTFKTLIKKDSTYVRGRLFGIAEIICEFDGGKEERPDKDGNMRSVRILRGHYETNEDESIRFLSAYCTAEQYEKFKNYVEDWYPGLCEFYWEPEN